MKKLNIIFAGTPKIAVPTLEMLIKNHNVLGVLTQADSRSQQTKIGVSSPIKQKAMDWNIPVYDYFDESALFHAWEKHAIDLFILFAYGRILSQRFLDFFPLAINIHPSLLPKYRGPSPLIYTILNGDSLSGLSIQKMSLAMDEGDLLFQKSFFLSKNETLDNLITFIAQKTPQYLLSLLPSIIDNNFTLYPQKKEGISYTPLIKKDHGHISLHQKAETIEQAIRAFNAWPKVCVQLEVEKLFLLKAKLISESINLFFIEKFKDSPIGTIVDIDKKEGLILKVASSFLYIQELQRQGKRACSFYDFYNGYTSIVGKQLKQINNV